MTGAVLGLGAVGYFLDYKFGWKPYGLLIGALLGVAVGMWDLYKTMFMERNK